MVSSSSLRLIYSSSHGGYPWGWDSGTVTSLSSGGSGEYNLTPTVVSLVDSVSLDVSANARVLSVLALREAGREVSEAGLLRASEEGDVSLVTLYLDAGVPIDGVDNIEATPRHPHRDASKTPLHLSCRLGHLSLPRNEPWGVVNGRDLERNRIPNLRAVLGGQRPTGAPVGRRKGERHHHDGSGRVESAERKSMILVGSKPPPPNFLPPPHLTLQWAEG